MKPVLAIILAAFAAAPMPVEASGDLPLRVKNALAHRNIPGDSVSFYVEDVATGEAVLEWNAEQPRTPASVMKLLTTMVALDTLGPTYRWTTDVYYLGETNGDTLEGDLLLKGHGDPYLVTERLWQLQRTIRNQGVRRVTGDLLLDDSWFETGIHDPAAFDSEPLRAYNVAPNALMTNYKVVRYRFTPDASGSGVDIAMEPLLANVDIVNRLTLKSGRCGGYQRGVAIAANETYDQFTFDGAFPSGCRSYGMTRSALDHNPYTYGLFKSLWEEAGGELLGNWKRAIAPLDAEPDFSFNSLSLAEVITKVNKHSNNVMARQLLYTLSAEVQGVPGTEEGGRKVVSEWLHDRGMDFAELRLDNGSGLSREARITATHMGSLLRYAWQHQYMPEFLSSLSLSGLDGTMSRRFKSGPLTGVAHMKTGSLDDVSSIAGFLRSRSGKRYAVVVLHNFKDIHRGHGTEIQEALLRWLYDR